jgi:hypothetical protein
VETDMMTLTEVISGTSGDLTRCVRHHIVSMLQGILNYQRGSPE